jgi:putative oxidoreductase
MKTMLTEAQRMMLQTKGVVLGRVLLGLLFFVSGISMATGAAGTAEFFAAVGVPMASVAVWVAVVMKVVGGGLLIVGKRVGLGAAILILFTLGSTYYGHLDFADPMQITQMLKNFAIIGGLIYVAAFGAGSWTAPKKSM